jgi:subtilisin family serine protease
MSRAQGPGTFEERILIMNKILLSVLIALILGTATAGAVPFENSSVVGHVPDRIMVTIKAGTTLELDKSAGAPRVGVPSLDALAARFSVHNMEPLYGNITPQMRERAPDKAAFDALDLEWVIDFPAEMGLDRVLAAYQDLPEVEKAHPVAICKYYGGYLPDDPGISGNQWYLRNMTLGGGDVRAIGAWNESLGDTNIVICILDSGVDWHHPDLGGDHPDKVTGAIWTNWLEYQGLPGVDDDGNGKIDDMRGWDFVNLNAPIPNYPDQDVEDEDNDPMDYESHGTNAAGCASAITNNGIGIAGTAAGCKIMAVRCGWLTNDGQGVVRMDFAASGMAYAAANGANIINCSWGSTSFLNNSVTFAMSFGALIITAAGNDDSDTEISYLNSRVGVLGVAATGPSDSKSSFSNFGNWVELSAPGESIYTTAYNSGTGESTYSSVDGTSFASPIACGAAALIWSANPTWNWQTVSSRLISTCDNIDAQNPDYVGQLGGGRINLQKALGDNIQQYPAEYPTLYDAINCAVAADTVKIESTALIDDPVSLHDRGIKFFGGYDASYTMRDPENSPTVITGNISTSTLRFQGEVGPDTEVDGFLIQGGGGIVFGGFPYFARYGGGILLNEQSPTLRNLEITGNTVGSDLELGCGGGMMMKGSSPLMENISIHGNTGILGAGLFAYQSSPTMTACDISDNIIITTNGSNPPHGGGIHALDSDLDMTDCVVSGHLGLTNGGGMYVAAYNTSSSLDMTGGEISGNSMTGDGGGLYFNGGTLNMKGVAVDANIKDPTAAFSHGGGIFATMADATLDSLVVTDNEAHVGGGVDLTSCTEGNLIHSVLTGNTALFWGGALNLQGIPTGDIVSNTMYANDGTFSGGGGLYVASSAPDISNNIVAFNTGGTASNANGMALLSVPAVLSCNDTYGNDGANYSGVPDPTGTNGNISLDPLFCNTETGVLNVTPESPCAPAHSGGCGLIGALASGCASSPVIDDDGTLPTAFRVDQNFPNPFNPKTTIRFALPAPGRTRVAVFDVAGRHVKTLLDEELPAKAHQVVWTGDDDSGRDVAAGIYFYLVTSGDERSVGRMALVK